MATRHLLADLAAEASDAGLPTVDIRSLGGVEAARKIAAGEQADLVFLARDALDELGAAKCVDPVTIMDLAMSQVAVAVRTHEGSIGVRPSGPAFDAAGLRAALDAAKRIGYSTGPSGAGLLRMIEQWGVGDVIAPRLVLARPGEPVATLVARGEVDLGFQQLSELVGQPGIRIAGLLPEECAITTVFAGAVTTSATEPSLALSVLEFFASPDRAAIVTVNNFSAPGA